MRRRAPAARAAMVGGLLACLVATVFAAPREAGAGGGYCASTVVTEAAVRRIDMREICFAPMVAHVQPGATVTWVNGDDVPHTVTGGGYAWGSADQISPGGETSVRFDEAGTYPYWCVLHPGMIGTVVVDDAAAPARVTAASASTGGTVLPAPLWVLAAFAVGAATGVAGLRLRRRVQGGG